MTNRVLIAGSPSTGREYLVRHLTGGHGNTTIELTTKYYSAVAHVAVSTIEDGGEPLVTEGHHALILVYDAARLNTLRVLQRAVSVASPVLDCPIRILVANNGKEEPPEEALIDWCLANGFEHVVVGRGAVASAPRARLRGLLDAEEGLSGIDRVKEALLCSMWPDCGQAPSGAVVRTTGAACRPPNTLLLVDTCPEATKKEFMRPMGYEEGTGVLPLATRYYTCDVTVVTVELTAPYRSLTDTLARSEAEETCVPPMAVYVCESGEDGEGQKALCEYITAHGRHGGVMPETTVLLLTRCGGTSSRAVLSPALRLLVENHHMEIIEVGNDHMDEEDAKEFGFPRLREVVECAQWPSTKLKPKPKKNNALVVSMVPRKFAVRLLAVLLNAPDGVLEQRAVYAHTIANKYITAVLDAHIVDTTTTTDFSAVPLRDVQSVFVLVEEATPDAAIAVLVESFEGRGMAPDSVAVVRMGSGDADPDGIAGAEAVVVQAMNPTDPGMIRLSEIWDCTAWGEVTENKKRDNVTEVVPEAPPTFHSNVVVATCAIPPGWSVDRMTKRSSCEEAPSSLDAASDDAKYTDLVGEMKRLRETGSQLSDKDRRDRAAELAMRLMTMTSNEE